MYLQQPVQTAAQMRRPNDPDDVLVATFKHLAVPDHAASKAAGRPVFRDVEVCEIRAPGNRDVKVFPATERSRWIDNPFTGEQVAQTYAERFQFQYMQFKSHAAQTKAGTPLDYATFLTEARRAELRAQNVYTVEQLAAVDGQELKHLGPGGRELKNAATAYIEESRAGAVSKQVLDELEALRARNAVLEEDAKLINERAAAMRQQQEQGAKPPADDNFDDMTVEQLRSYITDTTGVAPTGSLGHKTLKRIAQEARKNKAA